MNARERYDRYMMTSMVAGFEPIEVAKAVGSTVTGADGKAYLDCFSGIAVCNAGHGHPAILAAARAQMEALVHCGTYVYYNPRAGELAEMLAAITPGGLQKSFLCTSGAEAVEGALRLAKQHTKRKEVVCLAMSFHGRTAGTLSVTGQRSRKKGSGPYLSGVAFAPAPYCYRCPFKLKHPECGLACAEHLDYVLRHQTAGDVAAFIAEPVLGEGGIIVPPPDYFKVAAELARRDGAVFVCDEVQSGFGRTGRMFAIEYADVEPEILCMAKGIAGGFPLGAFIAEPELANAFTPGDHLSTFGGNPVCCSAAMANIRVLIDERLPQVAAERGHQIMDRLNVLKTRYPLIGDVRGQGLMIGLELVEDAARTPAVAAAKAVRVRCRERGVLVGLGGALDNVIRVQPPLVITDEETERVLDTLEKVLAEVVV